MFRYERPQAFRYRQFYQIGAEAMGIDDPKIDAEIIAMLSKILGSIGLAGLNFEVTSIGCKKCRPEYRAALKNFLGGKLEKFCGDCQRRYEANPLRILDCKVPSCIESRKGSPPVLDYLCGECSDHFEKLRGYLELLEVPHTVNPNLVRGLDYYTKTAFEVTSENIGSQSAVAAGGRYDSMVDEFGGPPTPGIGFAMGMERIIPLIKDAVSKSAGPDLLVCPLGGEASDRAFLLVEQLRARGIWVEMNHEGTSMRSQMRKANRIGAKHVIVLGEDEIENGEITVKDMTDGNSTKSPLKAEDIFKIISEDK
jgi:histidyl-tRNA synthetase